MKLFLWILASILYCCVGNAQNRDAFAVSVYTEPQLYFDDGFNIGAGIEYQMSAVYLKAESFYFPNLNGIDYFDVGGVVGLNYRDKFDNFRGYVGGKAGVINRDGWGHAKAGYEVGFDVYSGQLGVGLVHSGNWREDDKVWSSNASGFWSFDNGVRLIYRW